MKVSLSKRTSPNSQANTKNQYSIYLTLILIFTQPEKKNMSTEKFMCHRILCLLLQSLAWVELVSHVAQVSLDSIHCDRIATDRSSELHLYETQQFSCDLIFPTVKRMLLGFVIFTKHSNEVSAVNCWPIFDFMLNTLKMKLKKKSWKCQWMTPTDRQQQCNDHLICIS